MKQPELTRNQSGTRQNCVILVDPWWVGTWWVVLVSPFITWGSFFVFFFAPGFRNIYNYILCRYHTSDDPLFSKKSSLQ